MAGKELLGSDGGMTPPLSTVAGARSRRVNGKVRMGTSC